MMMKRTLSLVLCAAISLTLLAGCGQKGSSSESTSDSQPSSTSVEQTGGTVDFQVLSGPTGVGAAWLMKNYGQDAAPADAPFVLNAEVAADNKAINDALVNGSVQIAGMATNVAANLYAKTDGAVQVLAVNTLGVMYILEKGDSVQSIADLEGKTLYAFGQGANPEYVLNHLLIENGLDPTQVDIQWMTAQEVTAKMSSSENAICMLPVPAATALMAKDPAVRQAVSVSEAWDQLDQGALPQGCLVARTEFVEQNPKLVEEFLALYLQSITFMNDENNREEAAKLAAEYGLVPNEKVGAMAIPQCNLTCVTGQEMRDMLEGYYSVLFDADPAAIGGSMPYDSFYYGAA